jgi:hypothetical protein
VEEDSTIESGATVNEDIIPNVNYTPTTDDKFQNVQDEKDDVADHIIADEKSKQIFRRNKTRMAVMVTIIEMKILYLL